MGGRSWSRDSLWIMKRHGMLVRFSVFGVMFIMSVCEALVSLMLCVWLFSQEWRWSLLCCVSLRWWWRGPGVACCSSLRSALWSCSFSPPAPLTWRFLVMCFTACWVQCTPTAAMLLCSTTRSDWSPLPLCAALNRLSSAYLSYSSPHLCFDECDWPLVLVPTGRSQNHPVWLSQHPQPNRPLLYRLVISSGLFVGLSRAVGYYSCVTSRG